jgi:hypothetical protein
MRVSDIHTTIRIRSLRARWVHRRRIDGAIGETVGSSPPRQRSVESTADRRVGNFEILLKYIPGRSNHACTSTYPHDTPSSSIFSFPHSSDPVKRRPAPPAPSVRIICAYYMSRAADVRRAARIRIEDEICSSAKIQESKMKKKKVDAFLLDLWSIVQIFSFSCQFFCPKFVLNFSVSVFFLFLNLLLQFCVTYLFFCELFS